MATKTKTKLSPEQREAERFVRTWERAKSTAEAAEKLDRSVNYVCQRANVFRSAGIELKRFRAGRPAQKDPDPGRLSHLDLARLQALLRGGKGRAAA